MNEQTKAPHCPKCGGELVHWRELVERWYVSCGRCDFHNPVDAGTAAYAERAEALYAARRLVRRELAEQALTLRAHAHGSETEDFDPVGMSILLPRVMRDYELLGRHPIRLPGEAP